MNPEDMSNELTADEAKASLGISTNLLDQMLSSQGEAPQEEGNPQEQGEQESSLRDQYQQEGATPEALGEIKEEIAGLREEIQQALEEETNEEEHGEQEATEKPAEEA